MSTPALRFKDETGRDFPEWQHSTLGEIATITSGGTPSRAKSDYWDGNIPWVTTSLIDFNIIHEANEYITELGLKSSSAKVFPKNTLLMAMYGQGKTRGKVAVLGVEATTNQACAAILLTAKVNTAFAFQNLAGRYDEIRELSNSGGQENLSAGLIKEISLSYPSLSEQTKISNFLTAVDEKITQLTQKCDLLAQYKKGVMQQIFSQQLRFKDDDGRDFPDWEETTLGNIATLFNGRAYKQSEWETEGTPVIRLQNLTGSSSNYYYSNIKLPENQYCEKGDLLYMWSATFGPVWWLGCKAIYHYHIWKIETNGRRLSKNYLYYVLDEITAKMKSTSNGSTMDHITKGGMEKFLILLPDIQEQTKIANFLTAIDDKINNAQAQLAAVKQYKQGLLQQMFV